MARCPLCSRHPAKRFCPAKEIRICPLCCGSKREVEIDCPSSCYHLMAGRAYENDTRIPEPHLAAAVQGFDKSFIYRHSPVLNAVCRGIVEERSLSPWLVDTDVIDVLKYLTLTMKTLSSGIYYETTPDSTTSRLGRSFEGIGCHRCIEFHDGHCHGEFQFTSAKPAISGLAQHHGRTGSTPEGCRKPHHFMTVMTVMTVMVVLLAFLTIP